MQENKLTFTHSPSVFLPSFSRTHTHTMLLYYKGDSSILLHFSVAAVRDIITTTYTKTPRCQCSNSLSENMLLRQTGFTHTHTQRYNYRGVLRCSWKDASSNCVVCTSNEFGPYALVAGEGESVGVCVCVGGRECFWVWPLCLLI